MELSNISIEQIQRLRKDGLNLTHLWLIYKAIGGVIHDLPELNALKRKLFVVDDVITELGCNYYDSIMKEVTTSTVKNDNIEELFKEWWEVYPATNYFIIEDKVFEGIQNKKLNKRECKAEFVKIVKSKDNTAEEIIKGTTNHIQAAKQLSLKKRENQISFIPNSKRYLSTRAYVPFIDPPTLTKNKVINPNDLF